MNPLSEAVEDTSEDLSMKMGRVQPQARGCEGVFYQQFGQPDRKEWPALLTQKSIQDIFEEESAWTQQSLPDGTFSSRMVHHYKPAPDLNQFRAKSRWCVSGHQDSHTDEMTCASTPQDESIFLCVRTAALSPGMDVDFAAGDSHTRCDPLCRPEGPLHATFCDRLGLALSVFMKFMSPPSGEERTRVET